MGIRWAWAVAVSGLACGGDSSSQPSTDGDPSTTDLATTSTSTQGDTGDPDADTGPVADSSAGETVGPPIVFDVGGLPDMGASSGDDIVCSSDLKYVLDA